jgi:hypothetical protein
MGHKTYVPLSGRTVQLPESARDRFVPVETYDDWSAWHFVFRESVHIWDLFLAKNRRELAKSFKRQADGGFRHVPTLDHVKRYHLTSWCFGRYAPGPCPARGLPDHES